MLWSLCLQIHGRFCPCHWIREEIPEDMRGLHQAGRRILHAFDREGSVDLHVPIMSSGKIYDDGLEARGGGKIIGNVEIGFVRRYSHNDDTGRREEEG